MMSDAKKKKSNLFDSARELNSYHVSRWCDHLLPCNEVFAEMTNSVILIRFIGNCCKFHLHEQKIFYLCDSQSAYAWITHCYQVMMCLHISQPLPMHAQQQKARRIRNNGIGKFLRIGNPSPPPPPPPSFISLRVTRNVVGNWTRQDTWIATFDCKNNSP